MPVNKKLEAFKKQFMPYAKKATAGSKIFPDTIIVAAALESAYGQSKLTKNDNNFFGVKGKTGTKYKTKENIKGKTVTITATFKHYKTPLESFQDYVKFISGKRYVAAGVTSAKNVTEQIAAIKKGGYATDANYTAKLISLYKSYPVTATSISLGTLAAAAGIIYLINKNG